MTSIRRFRLGAIALAGLLLGALVGAVLPPMPAHAAGSVAIVGTNSTADPCLASAKSGADFESATSGGSIITATAGQRAYVCGVVIVSSSAQHVSLVEGTGSSVCTGGTPSGDFLNPGTTAANGAAFAANGGASFGSGVGTLFVNATVGQNTCVLFDGAAQVNVHVIYVVQ